MSFGLFNLPEAPYILACRRKGKFVALSNVGAILRFEDSLLPTGLHTLPRTPCGQH